MKIRSRRSIEKSESNDPVPNPRQRQPGEPGDRPGSGKSFWGTSPFAWFLLIWFLLIAGQYFFNFRNDTSVTYSEFLDHLEKDEIEQVILSENQIVATLRPAAIPEGAEGDAETTAPRRITTVPVGDESLPDKLRAKGVEFRAEPRNAFFDILLAWVIPILIIFLIWRLIWGRMFQNAAGGGVLNLSRSRVKIYMEKDIKTKFSDVAGVDEAKAELIETVNFLKEPERYSRLGGRAPKGILLVGPPGTGKTLLARAVAGEASVPFFSINGSEFVELFVGMGAARVRDLFEQARKQAPCIIFIDELDALGRSRSSTFAGSSANDEKEQTLNQLLAELDGFDPSSGIVLLAATNRPEILDPALLRAGRFDRQVLVDNPDQLGREQILRIHVREIKLAPDVDLKVVASMTPGFSGADLANLANEAALAATRRGAEAVELQDFTAGIERIVAGLERRKRLMNPDEKKRVAYHEMGHATVALALQCADEVHKVSIIPRGIGALGYTLQRPTEDRYLITKRELIQKIAVLLGGRVAEQILCGDISTGASDDLVKASNISRAMVLEFGMSEKVGLLATERSEARFLPGMATNGWPKGSFSESAHEVIDSEIKRIMDRCYDLACEAVEKNKEFIRQGVLHLLERETLEKDEIKDLWDRYGLIVAPPKVTTFDLTPYHH